MPRDGGTNRQRAALQHDPGERRRARLAKRTTPEQGGGFAPRSLTRARVRADTSHAIQNVLRAIDRLMSAHGASGFADVSPLQRIWRDANVAARHAVVSPTVGFAVYGKALLGVQEKITPLV